MNALLTLAIIVAVYVVLVNWILPRLGVRG